MSNSEIRRLKEEIYSRIDELEDENALQMLHEAVAEYKVSPRKDVLDELTSEQQERLQQSIRQADEGKLIPNEDVKQQAGQWLSK